MVAALEENERSATFGWDLSSAADATGLDDPASCSIAPMHSLSPHHPDAFVGGERHDGGADGGGFPWADLIPTVWLDDPSGVDAAGLFDALDTDRLVFKRQTGGGAHGQFRLRRGEALPQMTQPMMVQPYLQTIEREGELSFIFIDGQLSHALLKRAAPGDYRIQSLYGGTETAIEANNADVNAARGILETLDQLPLYARVDMLRGNDGKLLLMELELIEPYLYPQEGPGVGRMIADALMKRL